MQASLPCFPFYLNDITFKQFKRFAIMNIVAMHISFLSPPIAYAIFYLKDIAPPEDRTMHIYRGCTVCVNKGLSDNMIWRHLPYLK